MLRLLRMRVALLYVAYAYANTLRMLRIRMLRMGVALLYSRVDYRGRHRNASDKLGLFDRGCLRKVKRENLR